MSSISALKCQYCGKLSKRSDHHSSHESHCEKNPDAKVVGKGKGRARRDKIYPCQHCGKEFNRSDNRAQHECIHRKSGIEGASAAQASADAEREASPAQSEASSTKSHESIYQSIKRRITGMSLEEGESSKPNKKRMLETPILQTPCPNPNCSRAFWLAKAARRHCMTAHPEFARNHGGLMGSSDEASSDSG